MTEKIISISDYTHLKESGSLNMIRWEGELNTPLPLESQKQSQKEVVRNPCEGVLSLGNRLRSMEK